MFMGNTMSDLTDTVHSASQDLQKNCNNFISPPQNDTTSKTSDVASKSLDNDWKASPWDCDGYYEETEWPESSEVSEPRIELDDQAFEKAKDKVSEIATANIGNSSYSRPSEKYHPSKYIPKPSFPPSSPAPRPSSRPSGPSAPPAFRPMPQPASRPGPSPRGPTTRPVITIIHTPKPVELKPAQSAPIASPVITPRPQASEPTTNVPKFEPKSSTRSEPEKPKTNVFDRSKGTIKEQNLEKDRNAAQAKSDDHNKKAQETRKEVVTNTAVNVAEGAFLGAVGGKAAGPGGAVIGAKAGVLAGAAKSVATESTKIAKVIKEESKGTQAQEKANKIDKKLKEEQAKEKNSFLFLVFKFLHFYNGIVQMKDLFFQNRNSIVSFDDIFSRSLSKFTQYTNKNNRKA